MRRTILVLAGLMALAACEKEHARRPVELLNTCRPGASTRECYLMLKKARRDLFPAGRLEGIEFHTVLLFDQGQRIPAGEAPKQGAFLYALKFTVGRDEVMNMLEAQLGNPLKRGRPPVPAPMVMEGDYWETEEGFWVCSETALAWYSKPIRTTDHRGLPLEPSPDLDRYVSPVPATAALWGKVGQLLIGAQ